MAARKAADLGRHSGTHSDGLRCESGGWLGSGGAAAKQATDRNSAKYDQLVQLGRLFRSIVAETLDPLNESAILFFAELVRKITAVSGDSREPSFLYQRISVTIQRFSSILLHNSFPTYSDEK